MDEKWQEITVTWRGWTATPRCKTTLSDTQKKQIVLENPKLISSEKEADGCKLHGKDSKLSFLKSRMVLPKGSFMLPVACSETEEIDEKP